MKPTSQKVLSNWSAKYACQRASPLTCLNQGLASELSVLAKHRELEGLSMNALSYEKSVGVWQSHSFLNGRLFFSDAAHKVQVVHISVSDSWSSRSD